MSATTPLRFDHFELIPEERVLRVRGEPVALGSRAFDLLLVLAQRHERLVTKQELLELVWPGLAVEENNIATQIGNLRKLLGASAIATLPGYGYRLTARRVEATPAAASEPTVARPRHNLPAPRTRFIGREAALAELARLQSSTRLLTMTGIGGCGKTRLAVQFAQQQLEHFADGVWFIDLAPLNDAERAIALCAAVLGIREEGDGPLLQRVLAHLETRQTLLLLDNCEHLIDGVGSLVDALLRGSTGTTILTTSREGLGVSGEQIYPVRSLSLPMTADLHQVQAAESVRVFVDRARLALPDFEIDDRNAAPAAEICRQLDGIALAIELAAARLPVLPVVEIAARLDDRFRLLTGGNRALPRHQTLHAAMLWSYELLSPEEQHMLRHLSVFVSGWTLKAAAEVAQCADDYHALTLLTALHDKSLVELDAASLAGAPRYRMLETVRQFAIDHLHELGESEAARGRHAKHLVALVEEAERHWRGPDQDACIARLRREHDNLVAALNWCCDGPVDPQIGLRLAAASHFYWLWNGVELGQRLELRVLECDVAATDTPARAGVLHSIAQLSLFRGRFAESLTYAQEALAVARRVGEPGVIARMLDKVGSSLDALGRVQEALSYHREALEIARQLDDPGALTGVLLNNYADAQRSAGDLDAAERCYVEALPIARRLGGRLGLVCLLNNLVRVYVAKGDAEKARRCAAECLPLARHHKIGVDLLEASIGLASCLGDHERAARLAGATSRTLRDWGYRNQSVDIEHTAVWIAKSRKTLGDPVFNAAEAAGLALDFDAAVRDLEDWLARPE